MTQQQTSMKRFTSGMVMPNGTTDLEGFVRENQDLVSWLLGKSQYRGLFGCDKSIEQADLRQIVHMGFLRAVQGFNPALGFKFSTYACGCVRSALYLALMKSGTVRVPKSAWKEIQRYHRAEQGLTRTLGRLPEFDEVIMVAGFTPTAATRVKEAYATRRGNVTPKSHPDCDDDFDIFDILITPQSWGNQESSGDRIDVEQILTILDPRSREIIVRLFGLDGEPEETLLQIGDRLKISRERVRQIKEKALQKLRESPIWDDEPE
ncbi:MAG: sigma-70 family RNA polymerase sigma factor [Candidatus Magasanikbacteria bacterium]